MINGLEITGGGIINRKIGITLNTKPGGRRCDASDYVSNNFEEETNLTLFIKNNTEKGYLEAEEGDGIDISSRMHHHRGNVQKGKTQTLTTAGGVERGVVVKGNYGNGHHAKNVYGTESISPTITTGNHGLGTTIEEKKNE